jgi:hypothetical protein
LLAPGSAAAPAAAPAAVAALAARALLDLPPPSSGGAWPPWLAPHQVPAAERLVAILRRHGGAVLADAVGLGKSYVALAVARALGGRFALVVPAILVPQWRALAARLGTEPETVLTHEALSRLAARTAPRRRLALVVVDEAHRFRNPAAKRYRALATLVVGARVLLVTATPVHNRLADVLHLLRLFLRDHALAALGIPSLGCAARGEIDRATLAAVVARLAVARSRQCIRAGYSAAPFPLVFPQRAPGAVIRAAPADDARLAQLVAGVRELGAGHPAGPLFRMTLLLRLASSLAAFRATLRRYRAFLSLARDAARAGRTLSRREYRTLVAPEELEQADGFQLPLFLPPVSAAAGPWLERDPGLARRLWELARPGDDPKAEALARLLAARPGKTIVFVTARATATYLLARLRSMRAAAVAGDTGWFAAGRATPGEVVRAFAPGAQGARPPPRALEADVLIATDLLSEGLNLQDAARVVHYDVPWTPARLAQRVGRIDRIGSAHARIETVAVLPPPALERALALERRLAAKLAAQRLAGAAQLEGIGAGPAPAGALDWCDRLQRLAAAGPAAPAGAGAAVSLEERVVLLVVQIGGLVEAFVVDRTGAHADPVRATALLERAAAAPPRPLEPTVVARAARSAAALVRARLARLADARWRAAERHRPGRRLIPWALAAARRAARHGDAAALARLDTLVSRLALGMTAGETLLLEALLERPAPLSVRDVLAWHERLPPPDTGPDVPRVELVAALVAGPT